MLMLTTVFTNRWMLTHLETFHLSTEAVLFLGNECFLPVGILEKRDLLLTIGIFSDYRFNGKDF